MSPLLSPSPTPDQSATVAHAGILSATPQETDGLLVTVRLEENLPNTLDEAGRPTDGLWDIVATYDRRLCYRHGKIVYLLGFADRWMHPDDFGIPNAEDKLEALLQKHQSSPSEFDPYARRCQAGCGESLISHVHAVIDKAEQDDKTSYLMEWKACETHESDIPDKSWIPASLKLDPHCRRSGRLGNSFQDSREK